MVLESSKTLWVSARSSLLAGKEAIVRYNRMKRNAPTESRIPCQDYIHGFEERWLEQGI